MLTALVWAMVAFFAAGALMLLALLVFAAVIAVRALCWSARQRSGIGMAEEPLRRAPLRNFGPRARSF